MLITATNNYAQLLGLCYSSHERIAGPKSDDDHVDDL